MTDNDPNQAAIVAQLKQYQQAGLKFEVAKEKLVSQGFSETDIDQAADSFAYDAPLKSDIPGSVTQYFKQHPDQAVADGTSLLKAKQKEDAQDERLQATADVIGGEAAPDLQSEIKYDNNFAHDVGLPYWLLVVLLLAVNGAAYLIVTFFNISAWFYAVNGVLTTGLIVYLIARIR